MKILVFTEKPFAPAAVKAIENTINASGNELMLVEGGTRADLLEAVKNAEGLIVRSDKIDGEVMDAAPNLKVIVRAGAGFDNIDLEAATKHGICVMNTPGQNSNAVAEPRVRYGCHDVPQHVQWQIGYRASRTRASVSMPSVRLAATLHASPRASA